MAFNNEIRVLNTSDTNHADNFNEPLQELLENTQFNNKQIGVLSEDTLECGFGKNLLFLGRDIDLKGFDKNINAVCTTTINNPSTFYDGDSSFVSVRYHTKDWQEVTFISFKDGLEWKIFKKAGVWGTWSCDSDKIKDLQEKCIYLNGTINLDNVIKKGEYFINSSTELVAGTGIMNAYVNVYVSNVTGHLVQKIIRHNQDDGFYIAYRQQVGTWQRWTQIATTTTQTLTIKPDLGISSIILTPKVNITGDTFTISGGLKLTKPIVEGTVVMSLPIGFAPKYPYYIFFNSWNYNIPHYLRLWVDTDGNIKIYGASLFPTQEIDLDFSRTVTF